MTERERRGRELGTEAAGSVWGVPAGGQVGEDVVVADSRGVLAEGLVVALRHSGFRAAAALDLRADALVALVERLRPKVVLLGAHDGDGCSCEALLGGLSPRVGTIVVLCSETEPAALGAYLHAGATICWNTGGTLASLAQLVRRALDGEALLAEADRRVLCDAFTRRAHVADRSGLQSLTPREEQVLWELMRGATASEIARRSFVSLRTVRSQVQSILGKLRVNSQLKAVVLALESGWQPRHLDL